MLKRLTGIAALLGLTLPGLLAPPAGRAQAPAATAPAPQAAPRVTALFSTWDEYYFYAGFQVRDRNVISTNATPNSQPQQDDDVEVFFETDNARAPVRTPRTFQMAVSAASGAYFSVGDGTGVPKAKVVYTYKYAAAVDGTLNTPADSDVGYSVELAIPWAELGRSGPPKNGETWGFNVISRDRDTPEAPATRFYSLSPLVQSAADVQDPAKWSRITFTTGGEVPGESAEAVVCPHTSLDRFPSIDGPIVSGEYPPSSRLAFGTTAVDAPAPTVAQEPNTTASPFSAVPSAQASAPPAALTAPAPPAVPAPPRTARAPANPTSIDLPNGGSIKIVPGGIKNPADFNPPPPPRPQQVASAGGFSNPLTPKVPIKYQQAYQGTGANVAVAPPLGEPTPPRLLMAVYRLDYNGDARKAPGQNVWDAQGASLLVDQPINGAGPWFSGLRPLWHRQQLVDMRRAGIDVALVQVSASDPLLGPELDALVEALKEMKAAGEDYPLIGFNLTGTLWLGNGLRSVYSHVPQEFRATAPQPSGEPGLIVRRVPSRFGGTGPVDQSPDTTPTFFIVDSDPGVVILSPGGLTPATAGGQFTPRRDGQAYGDAWRKSADAKPNYVVIESWNDFTGGTELAASRQYGTRYVDDTRLQANAFNGGREWHAKYLKETAPRVFAPRTLYQIPVRVENAGTLPWRAGEEYSLCARWYTKEGRLADDSAPRIPIGHDVLPGQAVTLSLGVVARNGYGDNLDPGDYTLVIDMVQGQYRWFSFAGDSPLQIPVRVAAAGDPSVTPQATFIGTTTPAAGQAGETYRTEVDVRNDGPLPWPENKYTLSCKIEQAAGDGTLSLVGQMKGYPVSPVSVVPGEVSRSAPFLPLTDTRGRPLPPGEYRLHWLVQDGGGSPLGGSYDEAIRVVDAAPGASFVLSDIPREMEAGKDTTVKLAVQNLSGRPWAKSGQRVGYHWYYLDGTEMLWDGGALSPFTKDVPAGRADGDIVARVRAPDQPGRYSLAWDVQEADGSWASTAPASQGQDLLQTIITVTGRGGAVPVDLGRQFNASTADFDGRGHGLPGEMLPPDGTAEILDNPLSAAGSLGQKPGPPLYPDGYYAGHAGHAVPFLYPAGGAANDAVACQGQTLGLPGGSYRAIHILAAAGSASAVSATFGAGGQSQTLSIAPWTTPPTEAVAFRTPYTIGRDGVAAAPAALGDYVLTLSPTQRVDQLTLPNAPAVKIVAITLEK